MKLIEMTATFGNLDGSTLRLEPGLNRICAPNEWGKSTWCAFLTAMLYGIDTRERSGKDRLAAKERYAPWSGKAMEGSVLLEHEGRRILLRRWSEGRTPFSRFEARDADSGALLRELTGQNCGQVLLGVERSVFARSGFIRFQDMPVTDDDALRRRLNALVTTGDESAAADRLGLRLKELKNKCRYHQSGLIPQCAAHLQQLRQQLERRNALQQQLDSHTHREAELEQQLEQLRLHRRWLEYRRAMEARQRLERAQAAVEEAAAALEGSAQQCKALTSRQELEALLEQNPAPAVPGKAALWGCAGGMALAVCAAALGWYLALGWLLWSGVGCLCVSAAALAALVLYRVRSQKRSADILEQRAAWQADLSLWQQLQQRRDALERCRETCAVLEEAAVDAPMPREPDPLDLPYDETRTLQRSVRDHLGQSRLARGEAMGRMESLPQAEALEAQIRQTQARLQELELHYTALGYAQNALEEAMERLHRRFAPRITRRAQQLLEQLTDGRYDQLYWSQELSLTAAARDETVQRSPLWRSDGTADQMYLALRIAVWEELTPNAPLILDDALVRFDEKRLAAAHRVLQELSKTHQVINFCCR